MSEDRKPLTPAQAWASYKADEAERELEKYGPDLGETHAQALARVAQMRQDAEQDPAAEMFPHADVEHVDLPAVTAGIGKDPLVVTADGQEVAVIVSLDFFNRAYAALELLEEEVAASRPRSGRTYTQEEVQAHLAEVLDTVAERNGEALDRLRDL
ncbi:hypothetical protein [Kineococcus rhizosphaerae]|uniref:Antitoxin n=1 Tax=Kineococcus rhizosphaerae TaxID=559628 RepID=A0A2T0QTI9_9ACTN|nr:hypothetical protein [Kineococcus rhizosphaerae]PRY08410.1 hypothetical protein CLV37_1245 [Kineococcus rhizosphaerae]